MTPMLNVLISDIDAQLPQTQCGKCGYGGCWPYAEALHNGEADINRCPPGGEATIQALSTLLAKPYKDLAIECGQTGPRMVAQINEAICIGCVKCITPCPVDAIIGASKQTHTVINQFCTGCELCIPSCPVDSISLQPANTTVWSKTDANLARQRYQTRNLRIAKLAEEKAQQLQQQKLKLLQLNQTLNG